MIRRALLVAGGFVAVQLVFFLGLVLALQVPDGPVVEHLAEAVEEGIWGPDDARDRLGTRSDAYTECVVAGTGLGGSPEDGPLRRAAVMPRIGGCEDGAAQVLALRDGEPVQASSYAKYWAGYVVLTRPVIATLGLDGMRLLAGLLLLASGVAAFVAVRRQLGRAVAGALILPVVAASNLLSTPSTGFSQALSFSVSLATVAVVAVATRRSPAHGLVATALAAAVFCYVDLLTAPAVPWAFATFVAGAVTWAAYPTAPDRLRRTVVAVAATGLVWPAVFALTWISRWVVAALFLGADHMYRLVRSNIEYRTGGQYDSVELTFGRAVGRNVGSWLSVPTAPLVLAVCLAAILVALWRLRRAGRATWLALPVLAAPALIPFGWYLVLNNHSQIHAFFTHRGVPVALGILTAACWLAVRTRSQSRSGDATVVG